MSIKVPILDPGGLTTFQKLTRVILKKDRRDRGVITCKALL